MLVERCFQLAEQEKRISKEAAAAILYVGRACTHATYEAMQIFGGAGYTTEFEVERLWRDARVVEIGAGTTEIRQLIIARELLGLRGHEG